MYKTFNFPIECCSPQTPLNDPRLIETELGLYISDADPKIEETYEAFESIEIIPSLIEIVERIRKREDEHHWKDDYNINLALKWIKKWGYLKAEKDTDLIGKNLHGQRVSGFLQEADKFYDFWALYRAAVNRDIEQLKSVIDVMEDPELPFAATHTFYFFANQYVEYKGYTNGIFVIEQPLQSYQNAAIDFLLRVIEQYINNHDLYARTIRLESSKEKDSFMVSPGMAFPDLLDALYMQFFILLNENEKKICPVCNKPFIPERIDKKYCSNTCKLTAYRKRQNTKKII